MIIIAFGLALAFTPSLVWILLVVAVLVLVIMALLVPRVFAAYDKRQQALDAVNARLQENLSGIRVVKAFTREELEKERFAQRATQHSGSTDQHGGQDEGDDAPYAPGQFDLLAEPVKESLGDQAGDQLEQHDRHPHRRVEGIEARGIADQPPQRAIGFAGAVDAFGGGVDWVMPAPPPGRF